VTTFVFLHVGDDPVAELLVQSINRTNPDARLIQCTDPLNGQVTGTTDIYRHDGDTSNLMTFRLEAFSSLGLQEPAIYLDTDMLVLTELNSEDILAGTDVACCERSFGRDSIINASFRGMDLSEYKDKTLGEVYPILAAFTVTRTFDFWAACSKRLLELDDKFHFWYGDQEAMRDVVRLNKFDLRLIPESVFACLPEFSLSTSPKLLHFKGAQRKKLMSTVWRSIS
jgi:hypothetical protein